MMDKRLYKYVILVLFVSIFINHCQLNIFYEHNHHQGRHRNLLQGLGQRPGRNVLARLAAELRRLGRPNAFPRAERLPRGRARPPWPWPVEPGLFGERHERLCRRSCSRDRGTRSQGRDAGGPLHRWRRSRPLHWAPWNEAGRQSCSHCRGAADHAENRRQSRGTADGGVRQHAERPHEGPLAILQGPGDTVLWRQQAGRQGLAGHAGSVLALEHAGWPQERLRKHQGILRDRFHRGPQEDSMSRPWSCTARTTRSFPSRTRR